MNTPSVILIAQEASGAYLFWGFVLCGVALGIAALELVIPSGGLLALLSGAAVIASVVSFFMYDATAGVVALLTYLVLTPIVVVFGLRLWMNSPMAKYFVLRNTVTGAEEPMPDEFESPDAATPPAERTSRAVDLRLLVGAFGITITPLRPVGTVKIDERRIEALAENGTIDRGVPVVVTQVYDNQVKVRPR